MSAPIVHVCTPIHAVAPSCLENNIHRHPGVMFPSISTKVIDNPLFITPWLQKPSCVLMTMMCIPNRTTLQRLVQGMNYTCLYHLITKSTIHYYPAVNMNNSRE